MSDGAFTQEIKAALTEAGFSVSDEASNVQGSPYRYLFIYLTPDRAEGAHVLVSDEAEYGGSGVIVGLWRDYEDDAAENEQYETIPEAVARVRQLVEHGTSQDDR